MIFTFFQDDNSDKVFNNFTETLKNTFPNQQFNYSKEDFDIYIKDNMDIKPFLEKIKEVLKSHKDIKTMDVQVSITLTNRI